VLSLGRNCLTDLAQVTYLRKFKHLKAVCLEGNPVCDLETYRPHVLAYLGPSLRYLDYQLIDPKQVQTSLETYNADELAELRERELQEANGVKAEIQSAQRLAELRACFLESTYGLAEELFPSCLKLRQERRREANRNAQAGREKVEAEKIKWEPVELVSCLRCFPALKVAYLEKLADLEQSLKNSMKVKNEQRENMVLQFTNALTAFTVDGDKETDKLLSAFQKVKKQLLAQMCRSMGELGISLQMIQQCNGDWSLAVSEAGGQGGSVEQALLSAAKGLELLLDKGVAELRQMLVANEQAVHEQLIDATDKFEASLGELVQAMADRGSEFYKAMEDLEKTFFAVRHLTASLHCYRLGLDGGREPGAGLQVNCPGAAREEQGAGTGRGAEQGRHGGG
jgi:hypothetical protein